MSQKGMQKPEEYYSQFPDWYWKHGLHDAEILSISEFELIPDWTSNNPRRNCLEIYLYSQNAFYERDICKIRLYNYKIRTPELNINNLEKPWWIRDTLTQVSANRFLLEIGVETAKGRHKQFEIEFESAEIERK